MRDFGMDWTKSSRISIYPNWTSSISILLRILVCSSTKTRTKRVKFDANGSGKEKLKERKKRRKKRKRKKNEKKTETIDTRATTSSANEKGDRRRK